MDKYEFTPIIVTKDEKGNLLITEEQLKQMIKEAYTNGYIAGQCSKQEKPIIYRDTPQPVPYIPPFEDPYKTAPFWYDKFYCISDITSEKTPYMKAGD